MIEFTGVTKQFGAQVVLEDASLRVLPGEHVGVVGPNGAGKSTLFSLLQGTASPDKGEVNYPRRARIGHLRQQLNAHAVEDTVLDYVADAVPRIKEVLSAIHELEATLPTTVEPERSTVLGRLGELQHEYEDLGGYEMATRAEAALGGLGFQPASLHRPFASFSGGWQMRAELARTLIARPDILLLDEPSNYLDLPAVEWLQRFLRDFPGTMMLISHDRYLLETLTQTTLEVADGRITRYAGNYSYYARERVARHEQLLAARKNQDRKREEIERFVERFRAKNTKASQVQSRIKALEKMETIRVSVSRQSLSPIQIPEPPHSGAEALRLEGAGTGYEENHWVLRGVDLRVERGDKLALVGYNGMGKTTLLRLMSGTLPLREGKRVLGHKVVVGYQSQEFAETMPPDQSVYNIVRAVAPEPVVPRLRNILGRFGFSGEGADKPCSVLSGGEKIRLAFARIFVNPPNLLLLDEPTTHLDLQGRETLEEALRAYRGTVCLVSHDITFVRNVATSILAITPEGTRRYPGGYDYYLEKSAEPVTAKGAPAPARSAATRTAAGPAKPKPKKERIRQRKESVRMKRHLEKAVASAEKRIAELEQERDATLKELSNTAEGVPVDFATLHRRLAHIEAEIQETTGHWEEAALELESLGA